MTTTLLPRIAGLHFERHGFQFKQLTEARWRITNVTGAVVGYLEHRDGCAGSDAWAISRMTADRRGFVTLGTFGSEHEAISALKWM
ncbi:hypothetical protein [Gulosibacter molinativorax]|uniref:Uncharacterized protein n=1 Tax=Gulosibacter molinativorax TaxID=256821 RepID=A0ABT7C9I4_9MICO|nr:hypothetical protein [Gulosibacter molinativorax]MDJ1371809.1 hypothetical protein [Gulosibacter molinativorax]QUY60819.1 Hypotetical protein [Gulosibacter molinativorax]